ncbi:MAG: hypothetical protein QGG40_12030, partial [Myxococcota bacterium]|nr:hypothetical protein [Myxococcota bacterium]
MSQNLTTSRTPTMRIRSMLSLLTLTMLGTGCPYVSSTDLQNRQNELNTGENALPTAPMVTIEPTDPGADQDLTCTVTTESTDADDDTISYHFLWSRDGEETTYDGTSISADETEADQIWTCTVTPNDGTDDGEPGQDQVTISSTGDSTPSEPGIEIQPPEPVPGKALWCEITEESVDLDGDPITYAFKWLRNSEPWNTDIKSNEYDNDTIPDGNTEVGDSWTCAVTASDGDNESPTAESTVTISDSDDLCWSLGFGSTDEEAWVDMGTDPEIINPGLATGEATIETMVFWDGDDDTSPQVIISTSTDSDNGYMVGLRDSAGGDFVWALQTHDGQQIQTDVPARPNEWTHVALTIEFTPTRTSYNLYVDGSQLLSNETVDSGWELSDEFLSLGIQLVGSGEDPTTDSSTQYHGLIDGLRLSDTLRYT